MCQRAGTQRSNVKKVPFYSDNEMGDVLLDANVRINCHDIKLSLCHRLQSACQPCRWHDITGACFFFFHPAGLHTDNDKSNYGPFLHRFEYPYFSFNHIPRMPFTCTRSNLVIQLLTFAQQLHSSDFTTPISWLDKNAFIDFSFLSLIPKSSTFFVCLLIRKTSY